MHSVQSELRRQKTCNSVIIVFILRLHADAGENIHTVFPLAGLKVGPGGTGSETWHSLICLVYIPEISNFS